MRRCAFLTLSDPSGFVIDDERAVPAFAELGWKVAILPWDQQGTPWASFDAVIIRSTWDYQHHLAAFLGVLEEIDRQDIPLFNPPDLVRWNVAKTYLRDLAQRGVPVVPTLFLDHLRPTDVGRLHDRLGVTEVVVKPLVSGNAEGVFRLPSARPGAQVAEVSAYFADRPLLVQPFVRTILTEGEFSLFYFDGHLSHAILKTPAPADYRVQEEHGARIVSVEPHTELREAGTAAIHALPRRPLYARVDMVRNEAGDGFWVMELELIEPSLYLRTEAGAPRRFAQAFSRAVEAFAP